MTTRFLHGPAVDQVFAQEDAMNGILWSLTDNQGTVRDVVDNSGVTQNHIQYNAFGTKTSETSPATDFRYAFTGRFFDEDTNLQYNRARWYDSTVGRWLSEDPIGFNAGDTNLSRYVGNGTTYLIDPSGLFGGGPFGDFFGIGQTISNGIADLSEFIFGGQVDRNTNKWRGVGKSGMVGGALRTGTLRVFPAPDPRDLSPFSYEGALTGGSLFGSLDSTERLIFGTDAAGVKTSRFAAGVELGVELLPFGLSRFSRKSYGRALRNQNIILGLPVDEIPETIRSAASRRIFKSCGDNAVGPVFNRQKLAKILENHVKNGGSVVTGDEAVRFLKASGAQAMYLSKAGGRGTLVIAPNATRIQVIEELMHHGQHLRRGFVGEDSTRAIFTATRLEIMAQDNLLKIGRQKGWTQAEINLLERNRATWVKQLESLKKHYGHDFNDF